MYDYYIKQSNVSLVLQMSQLFGLCTANMALSQKLNEWWLMYDQGPEIILFPGGVSTHQFVVMEHDWMSIVEYSTVPSEKGGKETTTVVRFRPYVHLTARGWNNMGCEAMRYGKHTG